MALSTKQGARSERGSRSSRQRQRFFTGLILGAIWVLTFGWFTPLWAQSHEWVAANMVAQLFPDTTEPVPPPSTAPSEPESAPVMPVIPTDIEDHWAAACMTELANRKALPLEGLERPAGIGEVMPMTAQFRPNAAATWSDLADLLNRTFPTGEAYIGANLAETALALPSVVNMLYTYPPQYYEPDRVVSRSEAIMAVAAKTGLPYTARANEVLTASLDDGREVPDFTREGVAAALMAGILVNYPEPQQVNGLQPITRGEVAALVCQASRDRTLKSTIAPEWVAQPQPLPDQRQPNPEVRGVWLTNIDSDVLFSKEALADGIQKLKALNINTVYPVVWNMGYTQFPSKAAERLLGKRRQLWPGNNPRFEAEQGDRDMLQEVIELAHAEGMAVIPWFEFGFMAPANYAIRTQHPDWFTQRQDGSQEIQMGEEVFTWMNPFHPQTRRLLLLLMADVLENYDVEGIQVDDHLGLPVDMGYDPYTISLYQQEHDGDLPPEDYTNPDWMRWRADRVSNFMADVRRLIDQRKPGALLSVSPNPYPFSYAQYLQDWPAWEATGMLDEIIVQIYRNDLDRFVWELNKPATVKAHQSTPMAIGLLSGLRGSPTDVDLLTQQLEAVRDRNYAGVSYFFYESLWVPGRETAEERDRQFQVSFAEAVERP
jgi:uncharacterized lipoprotein YddW (UPF0748 family)